MNARFASLSILLGVLGPNVPAANAQLFSTPLLQENAGRPANGGMPTGGIDGVGIEQKLDQFAWLDARFVDPDGKPLQFSSLLDGVRPVVLTFNFSDCATVCSAQLSMLAGALQSVDFVPGRDFQLVTISLDHTEIDAKAKAGRSRYLEELGKPEADWLFLRSDEVNLKKFTDSVGYKFKWTGDESKIAHLPALVFLTPKGRIARYIGGASYPPTILRMSLVEASEGTIGTMYDGLFTVCFRYDAETNSYVLFANNFMIAGAAITIAAFAFFLWRMLRVEMERKRQLGHAQVVNG